MSHSGRRAATGPVPFLPHEVLPFVGRTNEIERILNFWYDTVEAQGLRALLLTGEEGIGKSRMLQEVMNTVRAENGEVLYVKLTSESATRLIALLADALHAQSGLTFDDLEERPRAVIATLQRVARLRPTLLVIEDIHLLADQALAETATLLQAITDEALSLVCVARNIDSPPRGILERYLVEEIRIGGLPADDIAHLWSRTFGESPEPAAIDALVGTTCGNPLAVGAALASAMAGRAFDRSGESEPWHLIVPMTRFEQLIAAGVNELAERMARHLRPEERAAAGAIAGLGEIFSREAAHMILEDSRDMLDMLITAGVVTVVSTSPAPVVGSRRDDFPASNYPLLAFTHSLLHKHLAQRATIDDARLVSVIGGDIPLYSLLPFHIVAQSADTRPFNPAGLARAVLRAVSVAYQLDNSNDWQLALPVLHAGEAMHRRAVHDTLESETAFRLDTKLLGCRLSLLRRSPYDEDYSRLVQAFIDRTLNPTSDPDAAEHLLALTYRYRLSVRLTSAHDADTADRVDALIERFPALRSTLGYVLFLREVAQFARRDYDPTLGTQVERRLEEAIALPDTEEKVRRFALQSILPSFLTVFSTAQELDARMRQYANLESAPDENGATLMPKLHFLMTVGMLREVRALATRSLRRVEEHGLLRTRLHAHLAILYAEAVLGADLVEVEQQVVKLCAGAPADLVAGLRANAGYLLVQAGYLRNSREWTARAIERFPESEPHTPLAVRVGMFVDGTVAEQPSATRASTPFSSGLFRDFVACALHSEADPAPAARAVLDGTLLRMSDLMNLGATLDVIALLGRHGRRLELSDEIAAGLAKAIAWCAERGMSNVAEEMLRRHEGLLGAAGIAYLRGQFNAMPQRADDGEGKLTVRMFGNIIIERPGEKAQPLRGTRLRSLLALMVADRMLEQPLRHREFCLIATGNNDAPDHARKVVNISVHRLREILGAESILTDAETPRLNSERVEVDLLDVASILTDVDDALARGALMRATTLLLKAFETMHDDLPFQTLNEPFFEAARRDFEGRVRSAATDVVRGLLYEGDKAHAELVLARLRRMGIEGNEMNGSNGVA